MKRNFEKALKLVLELEGGYSDNPNDLGGATNYGITQDRYNDYQKRVYPSRCAILHVKGIMTWEVEAIYRLYFWEPAGCNSIPDKIDMFHFCNAVNMGVVTAGMVLQRAINQIAIDADKKQFCLKVDGIIGPITLSTFHLVEASQVIENLNVFSRLHYQALVEKNPKLLVFKQGWMNRINKILDFLDNEK